MDSYKITQVVAENIDGLTNAVTEVFYTITRTKEEENVSASMLWSSLFAPENIDRDTFVPYEELTEEEVLSWIKWEVEEDPDMETSRYRINQALEANLQEQIYAQERSALSTELPWN